MSRDVAREARQAATDVGPFVRIAPRQLWSVAVDQLRELIDSGRIVPGTRLPSERDLCRQLGISRVSLREALRVLQHMGYIEVRRGTGTFARAPDPPENVLEGWLQAHEDLVEKLFELRMLIEPGIAALVAARAQADVVERLQATIDQMREADRDDDVPGCIGADAEFHHVLGHGTGNSVIGGLMTEAMNGTGDERRASLAVPGQTQRAIEGHQSILRAIAQGDPQAARQAMERHLRDAQRYLAQWRMLHVAPRRTSRAKGSDDSHRDAQQGRDPGGGVPSGRTDGGRTHGRPRP